MAMEPDSIGEVGFKISIRARFHGDPHWTSWKDVSMSRRIFIYSDSDLTDDEILLLQAEGKAVGHDIQFRSHRHVSERSRFQKPVAFISHDSRDNNLARRIGLLASRRTKKEFDSIFTREILEEY